MTTEDLLRKYEQKIKELLEINQRLNNRLAASNIRLDSARHVIKTISEDDYEFMEKSLKEEIGCGSYLMTQYAEQWLKNDKG